MPNYVKNKVYFTGNKNKIEELREFVKTKDSEFDFNAIVPMPNDLKLDSGTIQDDAKKFALLRREKGKNWKNTAAFKKLSDGFDRTYTYHGEKFNVVTLKSYEEWADLGDKYLNNKEIYGAETWYDWCRSNWDTKWNAWDISWSGSNYVEFETAWSMPENIYRTLAEKFPDVHFEVCFADEDIGSNCGTVIYDGDNVAVNYLNDEEFACDIWGYDYEEWQQELEENE